MQNRYCFQVGVDNRYVVPHVLCHHQAWSATLNKFDVEQTWRKLSEQNVTLLMNNNMSRVMILDVLSCYYLISKALRLPWLQLGIDIEDCLWSWAVTIMLLLWVCMHVTGACSDPSVTRTTNGLSSIWPELMSLLFTIESLLLERYWRKLSASADCHF